MMPFLLVSNFLNPSVSDRSMTQHWMKSSNFIVRLSPRSNTLVHRLQKSIDLRGIEKGSIKDFGLWGMGGGGGGGGWEIEVNLGD